LLLDLLLERVRRLGLVKAHARQRTGSSHVLAAVRALNRLELVRETMRHALDVLAIPVPGLERRRVRAQPTLVVRAQPTLAAQREAPRLWKGPGLGKSPAKSSA
jgi:hypothetical protein